MSKSNVYGQRIGANVELHFGPQESTTIRMTIDDPDGVKLGPDEINRLMCALRLARDAIKTPDQ